jgi:transposase InsO family protein
MHSEDYSIHALCVFMNMSRSSYYEWLSSPQTEREKENDLLVEMIKILFQKGRGAYGTRRIKRKLAEQGKWVSRRRIGRLLNRAGLACKTKKKFKVTTDSKHKKLISPNLLKRKFTASKPDRYYVGDITYVSTQEGWLFLAVVIDLFSRKVVGWSMNKRMKASLVNDALLMALWKRKPDKGLIWHTDRGSQYASDSHRTILDQHHVIQSMSRKGNCWEGLPLGYNAVSESFFHTLKTELVHHHQYQTREEAIQSIFEYIEVFYNRERIHSANDYLSPVDYEIQQQKA